MAGADENEPAEMSVAPIKPRRRLPWFSLTVLGLLLLVAALIAGAARWIDTDAGHRFVAARIAALAPASGLRIKIGEIDGSIYKHMRLRDVRFSDGQGVFARIDEADLQWYPLAWLSNRLDIDWLHIASARLDRLPKLKSTGKATSILPGFDIRLMDLRVDHLALGAALAGKPHVARLTSRIDIRSGRAIVDFKGFALDGADGVRFSLDSRPDDGKFNIDAAASAPAGGIIAGLLGVDEPMALALRGTGATKLWRGRLVVLRSGRVTANVAITQKEGRYGLHGTLPLVGPLKALGRSSARLDADVSVRKRLLSGTASLALEGLRIAATGGVDLASSRFDDLRVDAHVDNLSRFAPSWTGRDVVLKTRLAGPFDAARIDYLLTAAEIRQGGFALAGLKLGGEGRLMKGGGSWPMTLDVDAVRSGTAGIDDRLRNLHAEGRIHFADGTLELGATAVRASGLSGQLDGTLTPGSGALALNASADMTGLELHGLGRLDLATALHLTRPAGRALDLAGTVRAQMRRLDNGFLRGVGGGLPTLTGQLGLAPQGKLLLRNLHLVAPALTLDGEGYRASDGTVHLDGHGVHEVYGPLALTVDGDISKPRVDLTLDRPGQGMRLANVHALLEPDAQGYALTGNGDSALGPFTVQGAVVLPQGADARIEMQAIRLSDVIASGTLTPVIGGLTGKLALSGPADGSIGLSVVEGEQHLALDIDLGSARFAGPLKISVNRGRVEADMALKPHATSISGTIQARGVRYGSLRIGRLTGGATLVNGAGVIELSANNQNGRAFDLSARANVTPDRFALNLSGTIDGQPVKLSAPAVLMREAQGWRLMPVDLSLRGGSLHAAGFLGPLTTHVEARLQRLPLGLLDLVNADLGLGGTADGSLVYDLPRGGVPAGTLSLRVHGLTRSGLALSSAPIDVGVNGVLDERQAAVRAVIADGGTVIGRAQALLKPLGTTGSLIERLNAAPLRAQVNYAGSADTLWRLTNIELLSLGGRVTIAASAGGTLADPQISGTVSARDASLQSPATGMALTHITAFGAFNGAQLLLSELEGQTAGGGKVSGSASFTFSGARGIGMDIDLQADRAVLLDRDDVGATVTGPLRIHSDEGAGVISGNLDVVASRFSLGRASSVAQIPQIRLIEINRLGDEVMPFRQSEPWRLDVTARARDGLKVEGLGMQSVWSADLKITGAVTNPAFSGTANLISGTYDFAGNRFDLQEGRLTFTGTTPVNPTLNIRASANSNAVDATITVTGTSLHPIINISSTTGLPQDELLSRLLFGTSVTKLSAPEALQLAAAVASFQGNGSGLDPINAVRRVAGLSRLRILPADTTTGQKTSIAAGKNITRHLYVELITDGQGYSATSIEYRITRWLSLLSTVSSIGRQSVSARVSKDY